MLCPFYPSPFWENVIKVGEFFAFKMHHQNDYLIKILIKYPTI